MSTWDDLDGLRERVFKNQTQFDYSKWGSNVTDIKFMSVQWDAAYEHVVDWPNDQMRDQFFDAISIDVVEEETNWNFKDLGSNTASIRVPVQSESMAKYNYVAVHLGDQPVPFGEQPRNRYYYFITSKDKVAANTTALQLKLDTWTTYKNSVNIESIQLSQGHYAHSKTSATKFLSDPLSNTLGLGTEEPGLSSLKPVVSSDNLISFQKSNPRVCIATTADLTKPNEFWLNVANLVGKTDSNGASHPTNKATPADYWWEKHPGGLDSNKYPLDANAPMVPVSMKVDGATPGLRVYSMSPDDYAQLIDFLKKKMPQVIKSIHSVFLLDSALITEASEFTFFNYSMKVVNQQADPKLLDTLKLNKNLFNYDSAYADFAKLYTSQFALIEVSSLNGKTVEISIEDVSEDLEFYARSSTAFPFLKLEAFINGVGGKTKKSYAVKPWTAKNATLFQSDWEKFKFDLDIPTYGVFMEAREDAGPASQASASATRISASWALSLGLKHNAANFKKDNDTASISYNNTKNSLVNGWQNTLDSRKIANTITKADINRISKNIADSDATSYTNIFEGLSVNNTNVRASVNNSYNMATRSRSTKLLIDTRNSASAQQMAADTIAKDFTNSTRDINTSDTIVLRSAKDSLDGANYHIAASWDSYYLNRDITKASTIMNVLNMGEMADLKIMTGALETLSGAIGGMNPVAMLGSGISSVLGVALDSIALEKQTGLVRDQTNLANSDDLVLLPFETKGGYLPGQVYTGQSKGRVNQEYNIDLQHFDANSADALVKANQKDSKATAIANLADSNKVAKANNGKAWLDRDNAISRNDLTTGANNLAARDVALGNQERSLADGRRSSALTNALKIRLNTETKTADLSNEDKRFAQDNKVTNSNQEVSMSNNDKTYDQTKKNIITGRDQGLDNLNNSWDGTVDGIKVGYYNTVGGSASSYGATGGSAWIDNWGQKGLNVKVRRCSKETEKLAGDRFYRFGYYTPGLWVDLPELSLMTKFSFWKAEEIWVTSNSIDESQKQFFKDIFLKGTTVWADPLELFEVDIKTNKPRSL